MIGFSSWKSGDSIVEVKQNQHSDGTSVSYGCFYCNLAWFKNGYIFINDKQLKIVGNALIGIDHDHIAHFGIISEDMNSIQLNNGTNLVKVDVNECDKSNTCDDSEICVNNIGSFKCLTTTSTTTTSSTMNTTTTTTTTTMKTKSIIKTTTTTMSSTKLQKTTQSLPKHTSSAIIKEIIQTPQKIDYPAASGTASATGDPHFRVGFQSALDLCFDLAHLPFGYNRDQMVTLIHNPQTGLLIAAGFSHMSQIDRLSRIAFITLWVSEN